VAACSDSVQPGLGEEPGTRSASHRRRLSALHPWSADRALPGQRRPVDRGRDHRQIPL